MHTTNSTQLLSYAALTSAGMRPVNEDLVFSIPGRGLCLVLDGCGGAGKGEVASAIVLECLQSEENVEAALHMAHERILSLVSEDPTRKGMGATFALAKVEADHVELYHLGEVRAYLSGHGEIRQLTEDHTLAAQLVKLKNLKQEEADHHPSRKTLTRYLGKEGVPNIARQSLTLKPGECLFLCSDGFYTAVDLQVLTKLAEVPESDLERVLQEAIDMALAGGSQDNVSIALVRMALRPSGGLVEALGPLELAATFSQDTILRSILEKVVQTTNADRAFVALVDGSGHPTYSLVWGHEGPLQSLFPHSSMIIRQVLVTGKPLWLPDSHGDAELRASGKMLDLDLHAIFSLPLKIGDEVVGIIYLDWLSPNSAFGTEELAQLESLATYATLSVYNGRMHQEMSARMQKLQRINEVSLAINSTLELDRLLGLILHHSLALSGGDQGYILLGNQDHELTCLASLDQFDKSIECIAVSRSVISRCFRENRSICILDTHEDEDLQSKSIMALDLRSVMCVPLVANDLRIGVLYISSQAITKTFTPQDQSILEAIANQAALTIRNAQLLAEQEKQIGELEKAIGLFREAQTRAVTDGLTGLYNHLYFKEQLNNSVLEAARYDQCLSIIMIDLDHFKSVNDTYGHQTGDEVLRNTSALLRTLVRECDVLARYGGEELAVLLPQTDQSGAAILAERIREALAAFDFRSMDGVHFPVTGSFGVAGYRCGQTSTELLENADRALYAAKNGGRNRVCVSGQEIQPILEMRKAREAQIDSYLSVVAALSEATNVRDDYTAEHSLHLGAQVAAMAQALGLSERQQKEIEVAAVLHDVGKIGVPDAILQKPGPLDAQEWQVMRTHPVLGARILQAGNLHGLAKSVRHHHEWWDGSGYPDGLKGEEIPLASRVVAIIDAYGAMMTDRKYRKNIGLERTIDELTRGAGTQFDPNLIEIFLSLITPQG